MNSHQLQKKLKKLKTSAPFPVLADFYRKHGYLELAEKVCHKGIQKNPHYALGYTALGQVYFDQGEFQKALQAFIKASEKEPNNLLALRYMGEIYIHLQNLPKALKVYQMILVFYPDNQWAKKMNKKLNSLCLDRYRYFSCTSLNKVAKVLSQKEFLQRKIIHPLCKKKPHSSKLATDKLSSIEKQALSQAQFAVRSKQKQDLKIKQLNQLLTQFQSHLSQKNV